MTKRDLINKNWWVETGVRTMRTVAQTALSMLTVGQALFEVNWMNVCSISAVSGIMCVLTAVAFGHNEKKGEQSNE